MYEIFLTMLLLQGFKLESVSDVPCRQCAVIEFPVAKKESVGNIYKHLSSAYGSAMMEDRKSVV